jgi:hypothetical protein
MTIQAVYFYSAGGDTEDSIWVTDGTATGTKPLLTLPLNATTTFTPYEDGALFSASVSYTNGASRQYNIYFTTGTTTSVVSQPVVPIGFDSTYEISSAAAIGAKVIADTDFGNSLVVTDGSATGTTVLTSPVLPKPFTWTIDSTLYSLGDAVVFAAGNTHADYNGLVTDLWTSNGTSTGTVPLVARGENTAGLDPTQITVIGDKAVFEGINSAGQYTVWVTDGSTAGTFQLTAPGLAQQALPESFLALGSQALFEAYDSRGHQSLFVTDGTTANTKDLDVPLPNDGTSEPFNTSLSPDLLVAFGGKALFLGYNANDNQNLWVTDGTAANTTELHVAGIGSFESLSSDYFAFGDQVLFEAINSVGKVGLWISDGTSSGTREITPANAYFYGLLYNAAPPQFALAGAGVVFNGTDANGDIGLWYTDGTNVGTHEIDVASGSGTISPYATAITSIDFNSTVTATAPGQTLQVESGNNLVYVLSGDTVAQTGGASTIISGAGAMTVNATAGSSVIFDAVGGDLIHEAPVSEFVGGPDGAASTIVAAAGGADTIFAVTGIRYEGGAGGNSLFVGGAAQATLSGAANEVLFAGTGGGVYTPGSGSFFMFGGGGADTVASGAGSIDVWGNSNERLTVTDTVPGGTFVAFGNNDSMNAAASGGGNTFILVSEALPVADGTFAGTTTLVGSSAGGDTFAIFSEGSAPPAHGIVIDNWQASDILYLGNYGDGDIATANAALAAAASSGVSFTLSDQTTVTLAGGHPSSVA